MKTFLFRAAGRAFTPLMLTMAVLPVAMLPLCIHAPQCIPAVWLLAVQTVLTASVCALVPGRWRLPAGLAGIFTLSLAAYRLLPLLQQPSLLLLPAGCCALLLFSLPLAVRGGPQPFHYVYGLVLHAAAHVLIYFDLRIGRDVYAPVQEPLTLLFIVFLSLWLFSLNRITLENATMVRHSIPVSMRRFSRALTLAFIALVLVVSAIPAVAHAAAAAWGMAMAALRQIGRLLSALMPASAPMGPGAGGTSDFGMLPMEYAEPSPLAVFLERVLMIVVGVLFLAACVFLLWKIAGQLRRFARFLLQQLGRYVAAAAEEGDEITDTREESGERQTSLLRRIRRRPEAQPRSPEGRIRYAYMRLLRRHADWSDSSTARENLPENPAALYERARYSGRPVTQEDADRFAAQTRKL